VLQRHEDGSWLPGAVAGWNRVILEGSSSKEEFSTFEFEYGVNVSLNLLVIPGQDWANGEVGKAAFRCLRGHLFKEAGFAPVAMHEHDGLGRALLASVGVGVLVARVCHEVDVFLTTRDVRSKDFPVVATIFKSDLATQGLDEVLTDFGGAGEESCLGISLLEDLLHDGAFAVDQVHVFLGKTAVVQHPDPLLEDDRGSRVSLNEGFVAHVQSSHELEDGNLDREVEGGDHSNATEGPPVGGVELAEMVTGLADGVGQETDTITTEVLEEVNSDLEFGSGLHSALGRDSLDGLDEEIKDFGIVHAVNDAPIYFAQHQVALLVVEGVVETALGHRLEAVHEGLDLIHLCVGDLDHGVALEWVHKVEVLVGRAPLSLNQVETFIGG